MNKVKEREKGGKEKNIYDGGKERNEGKKLANGLRKGRKK